jgi:hypothetical protein
VYNTSFYNSIRSYVLNRQHWPFSRAGKGTVQRCLKIDLYKDEIDELYARYDDKKTIFMVEKHYARHAIT